MYINKINNLYKKKGNNDVAGGIISKKENVININHTGLGNNLFEIACHLAYCFRNNLNYSFPDINLLYEKIPKYPQDTIYRNLPIKKCKNSKIINNTPGFYFKHFHKYRDKLVSIFSIDDNSLEYINNKYFNTFKNKITVSMHVRRGDYVVITKIWNSNYINKKDYYNMAYKLMKKKLNSDFELLIISDDIDWCKENLKYPNSHYIKNIDYIDLWIMTLCDHTIICGSTFSWWGAYLNKNFGDNIVICPRKSIFKERKNVDEKNKEIYFPYWDIIDDLPP
jgi:hypothetical protein